jgi:transcriptional regulator with XRE-family HTH domain
MPTNTDLGRALARLRRERGLSVAELARRADCTPAWLAEAERGAFSPAWSEIGLLAQALDLRVSTFIGEIELESRAAEA